MESSSFYDKCPRNLYHKLSYKSVCSASIEDLHDEILTNILCRLPYKSAFSCKCVSKRWHSLISEPDFVVCFLNANRRELLRARPEWTLLIQTAVESNDNATTLLPGKGYSCKFHLSNPNFASGKFGFEFLPFDWVGVASTFKDLVLCYTYNQLSQREYHICNPLTKQWTSLPSSPLLPDRTKIGKATLVCEDCHDYDNDKDKFTRWRNADYRYRVVVISHPKKSKSSSEEYDPFANLNLAVFCSETQQWRNITLIIPTADPSDPLDKCGWLQVVVCNKMLYFRDRLRFGSFDPFNVTRTTCDNTSFLAKSLPLPGHYSLMMEYKGRLLIASADNMTLTIKQLKPEDDKKPVRWNVIRNSRYYCLLSAGISMEYLSRNNIVIGVDPMKLNKVYLMSRCCYNDQNHLFLCTTERTQDNCSVKLLSFGIPGKFRSAHRLQLQWWPTPVPQISS